MAVRYSTHPELFAPKSCQACGMALVPSPTCSVTQWRNRRYCPADVRRISIAAMAANRRPASVESERFWTKVDRNGPAPSYAPHLGACWLWVAAIDPQGYGRFNSNRRSVHAHRFAYQLVVGPVPAGLELDHLCRTQACVNPAHMEPVTHAENVRRVPLAVRLAARPRKTHCIRGHELTESNLRGQGSARRCRECSRQDSRRRRAVAA